MRAVIQRVKRAKVTVGEDCVGAIKQGLLVFIGVGKGDTKEIADKYVNKILKMRIFADSEGKTNLSLQDVQGEILVVSQFTLYGDCSRGNRPDFMQAAGAKEAIELYKYFLEQVKIKHGDVVAGKFGADMQVEIINDGPFTIVLDEKLGG